MAESANSDGSASHPETRGEFTTHWIDASNAHLLARVASGVFDHAIDQSKGIAMGEESLNLLRGQHHWLGLNSGLNQGLQPGVELDKPARTAANEV